MWRNLVLLLAVFVSVDLSQGILTGGKSVPKIEWTHQISLPADVQLRWSNTDAEWITMEMSTPAKGYIGIGFSPKGGMAGNNYFLHSSKSDFYDM
jgi:hypothetical protein